MDSSESCGEDVHEMIVRYVTQVSSEGKQVPSKVTEVPSEVTEVPSKVTEVHSELKEVSSEDRKKVSGEVKLMSNPKTHYLMITRYQIVFQGIPLLSPLGILLLRMQ
jgi:hypothetical protein